MGGVRWSSMSFDVDQRMYTSMCLKYVKNLMGEA